MTRMARLQGLRISNVGRWPLWFAAAVGGTAVVLLLCRGAFAVVGGSHDAAEDTIGFVAWIGFAGFALSVALLPVGLLLLVRRLWTRDWLGSALVLAALCVATFLNVGLGVWVAFGDGFDLGS